MHTTHLSPKLSPTILAISLLGCFDGSPSDATGTGQSTSEFTQGSTSDSSTGAPGTGESTDLTTTDSTTTDSTTTDSTTTDSTSGDFTETGEEVDCSQNFNVLVGVVASYHNQCRPDLGFPIGPCWSAADVFCKDNLDPECTNDGDTISGFPVEANAEAMLITCIEGNLRASTFGTLAQYQPACDGLTEEGVTGLACRSAIQHDCIDLGLTTGFGPNQYIYPNVWWTCLDDEHAVVVAATLVQLALQHQNCVTGTEPLVCTAAAHRHCGSLGHESGYGPIEIVGNLAYVVCTD